MYPNYRKLIFPYENQDGSITWVVEYPDLPGCSAVGDTEESALQESKIARELWLDEYHDVHGEYPVSRSVNQTYSGKLLLRLPKTLHGQLAMQADEEGVSLNTLAITLLAQNYCYAKSGNTTDLRQFRLSSPTYGQEQRLILCDSSRSKDYCAGTVESGKRENRHSPVFVTDAKPIESKRNRRKSPKA